MTRSGRFKPVVKLTASRERNAARSFAETQKTLREYQERLKTLQSYREEYASSLNGSNITLLASQLRERQKFLQQIDKGISALTDQIKQQQQLNLQDHQGWMAARQKMDAMDKIFFRLRSVETRVLVSREQCEIDDLSQHMKKRV